MTYTWTRVDGSCLNRHHLRTKFGPHISHQSRLLASDLTGSLGKKIGCIYSVFVTRDGDMEGYNRPDNLQLFVSTRLECETLKGISASQVTVQVLQLLFDAMPRPRTCS